MALRVVLAELKPVSVMSPVALNTMVPVLPSILAPSAILMLVPLMTRLPFKLSRLACDEKFTSFNPPVKVMPWADVMVPVMVRP